jgi:hypothetical protein
MTQFTNTNTQSNIDATPTHDTTPDTTSDTTSDTTAAADIITARNDYRWTPACQRAFLEELACSGSVRAACAHVAKSPRAAYGLRFRRDGAALALGWDAAILIARAVVRGKRICDNTPSFSLLVFTAFMKRDRYCL